MIGQEVKKRLLTAQKKEITEHFIYEMLAASVRDPYNKKILESISQDELRHYNVWKKHTGQDAKPNRLKVWGYYLISRIFGITFGIKLMERGEGGAQTAYREISESVEAAGDIAEDEDEHEKELIGLIDEERLRYTGDIVRGLNVALVELTGTVAGLTFALQNSRLIITAALIAGIAMSLSVGSTEYLATRSAGGKKSPSKAVIYAALANLVTVLFLIFPYLVLANVYFSLVWMIFNAIIIVFIFTFYISIAKDVYFKTRFVEMVFISLGVAALAFGIGILARTFLHIDIH